MSWLNGTANGNLIPNMPSSGLADVVRAKTDPVTGRSRFLAMGLDQGVQAIPGFIGSDKPTLVFVRDHAYKQIVGDSTHASMHAWFKANGLYPYSLTINTTMDSEHSTGSSVAPGGSAGMAWAEVAALQADGIEITNHTNRHIGSLRRANTGFNLKYTGANGTATAYVVYTTGIDPVLHCVDSSDHTFDLMNASYDTLAKLKVGVEALTGWAMTLAPELDGTELSKNTLGVAVANAKNVKTTGANFAISSGLMIRYKGTALRTAYTRVRPDGSGYGLHLHLLGDGVVLAEIAFSSASYDTLAELATYINGTAFGGDLAGAWECYYLDNEGVTGSSYTTGVEATRFTLGGLPATAWMDCLGQYAYLCCGLPIQAVLDKLLKKAKDTATAHGVTLKNFSDVGGPAPSNMMPFISNYNNMGRTTYQENIIAPYAMPIDAAWAVPAFGADDNTTSVTTATVSSVMDALADSPGFVVSPFLHQLKVDGSTGYSFIDYDSNNGVGYQSETKVAALVAKVAALHGQVNILTQQGFYEARQMLAKPSNRIFNPRFLNTGETMTGIANSLGLLIPGWKLASINATEWSIADGKITCAFDTASASNYIAQIVYAEPGKTYQIGALVEAMAYTSGTGVTMSLLPASGVGASEELGRINNNEGIWINDPVTTKAKQLSAMFTVPALKRKKAYIRSIINSWDDDTGLTWNLSTTKHIKINCNGIGAIEIDCSAGAGSAAAVYAWEIAAAINAAMKASATYAKYPEYHTIARGEAGYLILETPWPAFWVPTAAGVTVTAGTTTDATLLIFGGQSGADRPFGFSSVSGGQGMLHPYVLTITLNAVGRFRVSLPHCVEIESVT